MSRENLFMPYANNRGADQPAHPHSLISAFVVRCQNCIISILAKSKISRLQLASEAEQPSLSLTWSETLKTGFLVTWPMRLFIVHQRVTKVFYVIKRQENLVLCNLLVFAPTFAILLALHLS